MSYMRELIEHSDAELIEELERRADRRARGLCDYCEHPLGMPIAQSLKERGTKEDGNPRGASQEQIDRLDPKAVCRFPDRHCWKEAM